MFVEVVYKGDEGVIAHARKPGRNMVVSCADSFTMYDISRAIELNYICLECGNAVKVQVRFRPSVPMGDILFNYDIEGASVLVIFPRTEGSLDFVWKCMSDSCVMARRWVDDAMPQYGRKR